MKIVLFLLTFFLSINLINANNILALDSLEEPLITEDNACAINSKDSSNKIQIVQSNNKKITPLPTQFSPEDKIKHLAQNYKLVLFIRSKCKYCVKFKPKFQEFVKKYNFNHEILNTTLLDVTIPEAELITKIEVIPTIMLVNKKNSHKIIEFSRGDISFNQLEKRAVKAWNLLQPRKL